MKRNINTKRIGAVFITVLLILSSAGCISKKNGSTTSATDAAYKHLFTDRKVMDIHIEIADEDWQDILANPMEEEYHEATVTVNDRTVNNVGFRTKGFSSLMSVANSDSDRYGFRVKLDKYTKGQNLDGLNEFVLNSSFSDPSYMREYLTYAAMAKLGGITPYLNYCNLYINGELFGFYLCVEAVDDSFTERYSTSNSNDTALYKAEGESATLLSNMALSEFELKNGDDEALANIQKLVDVLNKDDVSQAELEALIDVDSVLRATAVNTVMGNYDSYSGSKAHNYYLLYTGGKFSYVGWDYNMSVGGFMEDGGTSVIADINTPVYGTTIENRPLIGKLLAIEDYKARYQEYLNKLIEYFSDFEQQVAAISSKIGDYVKNDPSAFYTYDEFKANTKKSDTDLIAQAETSLNNTGAQPGQNGFGGDWTLGMSGFPDGNMPDGFPTDGKMPEGFPTGGKMPEGFPTDGKMPDGFPQGEGMPDGFPTDGNGMAGMINSQQVSIVDYITQRLMVVKGLLDGTYTGKVTTGSAGGFGNRNIP